MRVEPSATARNRSAEPRATAVTEDLLAGALAGLAVAMPIGAIGSYLVGLAARERLAAAIAAALGVATVDGAYALVAAVGGAGLQPVLQRVSGGLTLAAAVVLVAVALRTLQVAVRRYRSAAPGIASLDPQLGPFRAYLTLIGMTAVNPATVITFAAVVLGRSADARLDRARGRALRARCPGGLRDLATAAGRRRLRARPAASRPAGPARHRPRLGRDHARPRGRGAGAV